MKGQNSGRLSTGAVEKEAEKKSIFGTNDNMTKCAFEIHFPKERPTPQEANASKESIDAFVF
jgi:hypothetical protein